ncbi:hypothetical protein NB636_01165 [Oxalobacter aliiformigenes]|uniref:hypothetical protein n=1 Tax=Oxalobacter aliiformigenes TaxID=2946593 RepID=UPI0022B0296F|nr:hypothetical protein [Oxalobacter aliiformigenes]MCZ4064125.1 hypothetical protein [Oxalobacter aliiformigenes]WAV99501.1 hypothetical protein NB636_01165 [Oxalobacter aliiformigenes]
MKQKLLVGIACLIIGFVAGWLGNGWRMSTDSTTEKLSAVQANADHFADVSRKVNEAATEHVRNTDELNKQIAELKKELAHAKKNHPVPADCRPDADRLRVLKDAVTAANTAAGQ